MKRRLRIWWSIRRETDGESSEWRDGNSKERRNTRGKEGQENDSELTNNDYLLTSSWNFMKENFLYQNHTCYIVIHANTDTALVDSSKYQFAECLLWIYKILVRQLDLYLGWTRQNINVGYSSVQAKYIHFWEFYIHGSVHRSSILIRSNDMQQYAGVYLLQNYSTCFGCLSHPSSGVHQTVTAASGTGHSIRATTFRQRGL